MNKAFVRESDAEDDEDEGADGSAIAPGTKNYMTPGGFARLQGEWRQLMEVERPQVVEAVHWAAKNGDRSENGDYLYGKKRLREIDRRLRFLTRRLKIAVVVDPSAHVGSDQVFFGATVRYAEDDGTEREITIVGIDEARSEMNEVSWIAPVSKALLRAREGDEVRLVTPTGVRHLEILEVRYPQPAVR